MTEEDARVRAAALAPEAFPLLERYAELVIAENARQNLIARTTETSIWTRHLFDSLQLAVFARPNDRSLLDIGSGPGLPGIVLATLRRWQVTLVEPRRRRVAFLNQVIADLQLDNVSVVAAGAQTVRARHDLICARAVAGIDALFAMTRGCADVGSRFVLPRGRSAHADMDLARRQWHGLFHVEQSLTDPDAGIVIADRVARR